MKIKVRVRVKVRVKISFHVIRNFFTPMRSTGGSLVPSGTAMMKHGLIYHVFKKKTTFQDDNSLFRFSHALVGAGDDVKQWLTPVDLKNLAERMRAVEGFVGKRMGTVHEYPMAFYGSSMTEWLIEVRTSWDDY